MILEDPANHHHREYRWYVRGTWYNDEDGVDHKTLPCVLCKQAPTMCGECPEDYPWAGSHEPCVGHIDGVKGLCCGHGSDRMAYVAYQDGRDFRGQDAIRHLASVAEGPSKPCIKP